MSKQPRSVHPTPPPNKKQALLMGEGRRVPIARIGGQRATVLPSPSQIIMTTTGASNSEPQATPPHGQVSSNSELPPQPAAAPQCPLRPPRKVPPIGPNGRFQLNVINDYIIDYSEAVSTRMGKIFQERVDPLGSTWKKLQDVTKTFYFEEFKKAFEWNVEIDSKMVTAWERLTGTRYGVYLSRMRCSWKRKPWVPVDVWNKWCTDWSSSEAKAKSDKERRNRRGGGSGPAKATHTGGSVSARTSAERMETRLGRPPTLMEVFRETHMKGDDGQSFVDDRSKKMDDDIALLREQLGVEEGVDENQLYLRAAGGKDKQKRIYGIGSLASQVPVGAAGDASVIFNQLMLIKLSLMRSKSM